MAQCLAWDAAIDYFIVLLPIPLQESIRGCERQLSAISWHPEVHSSGTSTLSVCQAVYCSRPQIGLIYLIVPIILSRRSKVEQGCTRSLVVCENPYRNQLAKVVRRVAQSKEKTEILNACLFEQF